MKAKGEFVGRLRADIDRVTSTMHEIGRVLVFIKRTEGEEALKVFIEELLDEHPMFTREELDECMRMATTQ